ncbi:lipocalin family protein [Aequorivita marina]|uniref:lipocalin family protein n=1 Tax=Aequorivita marina TaxID=3073654 RepID=UPI002876A02E|nr:lipocalin family protein [Aequorivita sp. S2608]MDS1298149.1 lipocalin family protein [Aequorivita sp. S2608]
MTIFQPKLKALLVLLLLGTFLFSNTASVAQSLEGKWIPPGENGIVMQFTKDSLIVYNLENRIDAKSYNIKGNDINIGADPVMILQLVAPNRLRLKKEESNSSKDILRLKPTKTKLTNAEIEKIDFYFSQDESKKSFRLNKPNEGSDKIFKLEKIDSTYFFSQFSNNKRRKSAPIKSITTKKIVVNLSPEKSMTLLGKDADNNTMKTNAVSASIGELTLAEAIIGKWFYSRIEGRPSLSDCTKKTFFQFTEDLIFETKPYAKNFNNENCVAGALINGTYKVMDDNQIKVTQNGKTETWKINTITKTKLALERNGSTLTLKKE